MPFKRFNFCEITAEFNPYKKFSETYYYRLNRNYTIVDPFNELTYGTNNITHDMSLVFKNDNMGYLESCRHFSRSRIRDDNKKHIIETFWPSIWKSDSKCDVPSDLTFIAEIPTQINMALLFDSLEASLSDEIPDFYKSIFTDKPINYYKTMLKCSIKFIKALNFCIENSADTNDRDYAWYLYMKKGTLEEAQKGDRYRFTSYQSAPVWPKGSNREEFLSTIITDNEPATLFKIIVPKSCKNAALLSEIYNDTKFFKGEVLIAPYSVFTLMERKKAIKDSAFNNVIQLTVKLDVNIFPATDDEQHWMKLDSSLKFV